MPDQTKSESFEGKFAIKAEEPTYKTIKNTDGHIVDYHDVRIEGYANTFELDRGNEQVVPGAFAEHLEEYLDNPVLQVDHKRASSKNAGQVFAAYEDDHGLRVSAKLTNSPLDEMKDIRFKVAEGSLRTFSIGGMFHGISKSDRMILHKIELREISIVTVPMNKKSKFVVKAENQKSVESAVENIPQAKQVDDSGLWIEIDGVCKKII